MAALGCSKSPQDVAVADQPAAPSLATSGRTDAKAAGHQFLPYLRLAEKVTADFQKNVRDYSATVDSLERIKDDVQHRQISVKIRHEPFGVYAYVNEPADRKGEEALYVAGKNDGKVMVHTTGVTGWALGTMSLDLDSSLLMKNQRHPITDIGILNMCRQWVAGIKRNLDRPDCHVRVTPGVKVDGGVCTLYEIVHTQRDPHNPVQVSRIYFNEKLQAPIRYEALGWPESEGGKPPILEQYWYRDVKVNQHFTDADFDTKNPKYGFK